MLIMNHLNINGYDHFWYASKWSIPPKNGGKNSFVVAPHFLVPHRDLASPGRSFGILTSLTALPPETAAFTPFRQRDILGSFRNMIVFSQVISFIKNIIMKVKHEKDRFRKYLTNNFK